jgi:hypothetical protein
MHRPIEIINKKCSKCLKIKPITEFYKAKGRKLDARSECKKCTNMSSRSWQLRHPDYNKNLCKARYLKNPEIFLACNKKWKLKNLEKVKEYSRKRKKTHSGETNNVNARRRANKLNQTPTWANLVMIKQFYINCPKGYEVDHIVPLQGKNVSGFHVEYNLQYLTPKDNQKKGNRI